MELKELFNLARVPSILMLGAMYVAYVLIGGVIFWQLEGPLGRQDNKRIIERTEILLSKYSCLNHDGLNEVAVVIQEASKAGLSLKNNESTDGFWKFTSSAVFAATVVTTIGYGNISPQSTGGQIFCVFFALFGIPLNIVVLNHIGKYMLAFERNVSDFLESKKIGKKMWMRFFVHLISYMTGTVLFFVVPMLVFQNQEGWTYSQAIYYCFISLSTIGFGDFVAYNNPEIYYPDWYSILTACWIFFGLAWLAQIINHFIDILERLNNFVKNKLFQRKKTKEEAGGGEGENPETQVEEEYDKASEHK